MRGPSSAVQFWRRSALEYFSQQLALRRSKSHAEHIAANLDHDGSGRACVNHASVGRVKVDGVVGAFEMALQSLRPRRWRENIVRSEIDLGGDRLQRSTR